jgi:hypothetical protein
MVGVGHLAPPRTDDPAAAPILELMGGGAGVDRAVLDDVILGPFCRALPFLFILGR